MSHVRVAGLATADDGAGERPGAPIVVCVHGSMDRMAGFAKVARRLAAEHHVVRYDRRGYGHSAPHPGPFAVADHVADLVALIAGRPSVVVGHSLGGNIALAAAEVAGPSVVRAVAIYESPLSWMDWWPGTSAGATAVREAHDPAEVAEVFMVRMIGKERWDRLPEAVRAARRAEGVALAGEISSLQLAAPWDAGQILVPVIAGRGSEGRAHHQQAMEAVASSIAGARLATLSGCGHMAHTTHPDLFTEELIHPLLVSSRRPSNPL